MIVICIDNTENDKTYDLTIGRQYHKINQPIKNGTSGNDLTFLVNDIGEFAGYHNHRFISLEEKREQLLNDILKES